MNDDTHKRFASAAGWIRAQEIGRGCRIETPFGERLLCYADLTATGRHLRVVEDRVRQIRPFYANTHTEISSTGRMMTELRESARRAIRAAVNAAEDDEVLFVGAGATAAVNKLVGLLGLRVSEPLERAYGLSERIASAERPVVLVGPYEHHSNELPWLESVAEVVEIGLDDVGNIDLEDLRARLEEYARRPLKIGSFSAASNVTGVLSDVSGITRVLRAAAAFAVFDYAAAGPYVPIDMHPADPAERIDALFLSPHKFVGGPESSGILVAHRSLFRTRVPERPGGGTVDYVAGPGHDAVDYVSRLDEREEGGTPAILGDIRAALAFAVKEAVGPTEIRAHEISIAERAATRLRRHARIRVLGPSNLPRLAIVPITVEGLHHDMVSALLDHLFGIQNRAGCSCAGPYGHRLLGIDRRTSERFRALVRRGLHGIKPGWARLSLPYYASEDDLEFILSAVEFVADHGLDFVPLYRLNWRDGVWRHVERAQVDRPPVDLSAGSLRDSASAAAGAGADVDIAESEIRAHRARYIAEAQTLAAALAERWKASPPRWNRPTGDAELDELVWFRYAHSDGLGAGSPAG